MAKQPTKSKKKAAKTKPKTTQKRRYVKKEDSDEPGPKGPSKPLTDEDYVKVQNLYKLQCTNFEVASVMGMSMNTLRRRIQERGFETLQDFSQQFEAIGNASLRRMQWKSAEAGVWDAQKFLGKNRLGQQDKIDTTSKVTTELKITKTKTLEDLSDEEREFVDGFISSAANKPN